MPENPSQEQLEQEDAQRFVDANVPKWQKELHDHMREILIMFRANPQIMAAFEKDFQKLQTDAERAHLAALKTAQRTS